MTTPIETKLFHIGTVLTITSGKLVSPDHVGGIYNICEWMSGEEGIMTHQLPRVSREIQPFLSQQHPELAAIGVPAGLDSWEKVDAFLESLYPQHGQFVAIRPIPAEDHTAIDPLDEIRMIRPDLPVVSLVIDGDTPTNG